MRTVEEDAHAGEGKGRFGDDQRFRFVFTHQTGGAGTVEFDARLIVAKIAPHA